MVVKIDKVDRKILSELDKNARQPVSVIAKKLRVSRIVIEYRMKKLERQGVIRSYVGFIDPCKFGLSSWKTYVKFQNLTQEKEKKLDIYLNSVPNLWWVIKTTGAYDLMFCVLARSPYEYYQTLFQFQQKFNAIIFDIAITNHIDSRWFTRNYLTGSRGEFIGPVFTKNPVNEEIKELDRKILEIVASNCRTSLVSIANKLNTSARIVSYHLRELEKKRIIVNYRLNMDVQKIGYSLYKVLLSLKDFSKSDIRAIEEFLLHEPNAVDKSTAYGPWDMEFELEVGSHSQFNEIMKRLRGAFPRIVKKFEYVQVYQELRHDNNFIGRMS